jgi:hypothetical protein
MLDEISEGRSGWPSRWSRGRQGTSRASPTDSKVTAARLVVRNGHANPRTISTAAGASQKGHAPRRGAAGPGRAVARGSP